MGYSLILSIAAAVLTLRYVVASDAPHRTKYIVGGLAWASFFVPENIPYGGMIIQFGVCVFVLFHLYAFKSDRSK
jgi:hypothetical protein